MHVQALSIGVDVPTHCFSGTVHSVFGQACNLGLEADGLLTLLLSQKGNTPQGIRLNVACQSVFLDRLRVGQLVACRGGIIRIDKVDLCVDLRSARRWHVNLRELHIDLRQLSQARAWTVAWSELNTHHYRNGGLEIIGPVCSTRRDLSSVGTEPFLQRAASTVPALLQATGTCRLEDATIAIQQLIGCGPGLTPSGDDFLVGYVAGLWSTVGHDTSRMKFLTTLGLELCNVAQHTNAISCAYLRSAAKGNVSEPIARLAQQLNQSSGMNGVRAATQAALQVGHTSGSNGVLGLLLGCIAWQHLPLYLNSDDLLHSLVHRDSTTQQ